MKFGDFAKIKSLQTSAGFKENLQRLGLPMPCDDIVAAGYPREAVDRVVRLMRISEYKRRQAPVGIRVTPRAVPG